MHKDILHSIPEVESNRSSFSYLFKHFTTWQKTPTQWIALYEGYLKQFCTTDTDEVVQCLRFAGETYTMIGHKECALECYQTALDINVDDKYQMNNQIKKRIKILKKPSRTNRTMNNERTAVVEEIASGSPTMYEVQQEQWSIYWNLKGNAADKPSIKQRLEQLLQYLKQREIWYDGSEAKTVLCLPQENTPDLSVNYYRAYFLSTLARHISLNNTSKDASNHRDLSLWRYNRYMREWTLYKELEEFLQLFQKKSRSIRRHILPRLERLLKKLRLLKTLCAVYTLLIQASDETDVNNVPFINSTNTEVRQLVFFDLRDSDLFAGLEALEDESSTAEETSATIPDHMQMVSMEISDFIGELHV